MSGEKTILLNGMGNSGQDSRHKCCYCSNHNPDIQFLTLGIRMPYLIVERRYLQAYERKVSGQS